MSFCVILLLLSSLHVISSSSLSLNTYLSSSSSPSTLSHEYKSDGISYWLSLSQFQPTPNTSYGKIQLKAAFYMKFDLIWHGLSKDNSLNRPFESVFRIGIPSDSVSDCNGHATRYPALYIDRRAEGLQFSISDNIDCWGVGLLNVSYNLQINTLYTITIQYNDSWVSIQVNDHILYNNKRPGITPNTIIGKNVSIMFSDSLDPAANVTLSNIIILSYNNTLTMPPTTAPTMHPTVSTNVGISATEIGTETTNIMQSSFLIDVNIYVYYGINSTFDENIIKTTIKNIFGFNTSIIDLHINKTINTLYLNTETTINGRTNVTILIAYLKNNLTRDLITHIPTLNVIQIKYHITIKEIYITMTPNYNDSDDNIQNINHKNNRYSASFLLFDNDYVMIIISSSILLCLCSFILCICSGYKYCSLKYKLSNRCKFVHNRKSIPNHQKVLSISSMDEKKIKQQELKRLSHSISINNSPGSIDLELSLGTHVIGINAEGIDKNDSNNLLYQRVANNIQLMDDDDTTNTTNSEQLLNELTTDNFDHSVNMVELHQPSNSNLDELINDQIRITNGFSNEEIEIDKTDTNEDSSNEAMYDEGLCHINTTIGQYTHS